MEVITLAGYTTDEKMHIARDYLVKTTCKDCGIKPEQAVVSDAALLSLIENYCREAGVRNLKKHIEKIYRKIALKLVRQGASTEAPAVSVDVSDTKSLAKTDLEVKRMTLAESTESKTKQRGGVAKTVVIEESNFAHYVGKPLFHAEKIYEQTPVGVVMGLAWTSMGGSPLYIETTFVEEIEGRGCLRITGQLGDVMKESARIAHTVARRIMLEKEPKNRFLANSKLHLHVPEGDTPKDGPSAGCTMITSLLSLAMKKSVRKDLAMTGEVTLTGRILPIGGVMEKTMAAKEFRERVNRNKDNIPEHVMKVINEELKRLVVMTSDESSILCNYLDWLTSLPWGIYSDENCDVMSAEKILDEDHYGLSSVKERVLELIAAKSLGATSQGKPICIVGPSGVGKTSIARSIARALNRNFYQLHVAGICMAAHIKGSSRIVSAIPGKMVQCLKSMGTFNPVVLIDEIDKLGRNTPGETLDALLELLDPELNADFLDHYLNVTIDLSKVLFICTANSLDLFWSSLANKMEVITVSGYLFDEKMRIARDHLEKTALRNCGIRPKQVDVSDAALRSLIEQYCREVGVKNLQRLIEKIYRKISLKRVREDESDTTLVETVRKVSIDNSNLANYVGKPVFVATKLNEKIDVDKIYEQTPVGVAVGLSTKRIVYIETNFLEEDRGKGGVYVMTGQLGNVVKESAMLAHTFARKFLLKKQPKNRFLANFKIHLHGLTGVIGNDGQTGASSIEGPSAGCTMITSFLSLAMNKPVKKDLAMTGAISQNGRILPIGGVMEKTLAARRSQIKTIIFSAGNWMNFDELPQNVKEGLDVHFVDEYEQIFELAFNYD
ncbi:unnamed protein product [Arabis nemorensis]|uniref:endopeptidase La n=1 Tax=Arabis nemorensis TaxID=586526 RepID=A0A565B4P2_9BRAS|nr:unnamed protein product [Arabis nemorensis]